MSNCTQTLLIVSLDKKQLVLDKLAAVLPTVNPYSMDNWGWYPQSAEWSKNSEDQNTNVRMASMEDEFYFYVKASHPNHPPQWYIDFAIEIGAKLLYQDLDGYGNDTTWDLCDKATKMSSFKHTITFKIYHDSLLMIPFTKEFVGHC